MRAIDADMCEPYFYEHLDDNAMAGAMNAINEMPTIEPEQRWIPCSERLPESTDYYLVTVGINEYGLGMIRSVRTALYNVKTKDWTIHTGTNMCIVGDVVAWCDGLLEPYREEGETDESDRC